MKVFSRPWHLTLLVFCLSCGGIAENSPERGDPSEGSLGSTGGHSGNDGLGVGGQPTGISDVPRNPQSPHPAVGNWSIVGSAVTVVDFNSPVAIESVTQDEIVGHANGAVANSVREGSSSGVELTFFLQDGSVAYWFDLAAAEAGGRMTGTMEAFSDVPPYPTDVHPTARVTFIAHDLERYDQWKVRSGSFERFRRYELDGKSFEVSLTSATTGSDEFRVEQIYRVFFEDEWMGGDFGVFHGVEMAIPDTLGAPILVGPVVATERSSVVEMELSFGDESPPLLSGLRVKTVDADVYEFVTRAED